MSGANGTATFSNYRTKAEVPQVLFQVPPGESLHSELAKRAANWKCRKRNGKVVNFAIANIERVLLRSLSASNALEEAAREAAIPKLVDAILIQLAATNQSIFDVETIQRNVIAQLWTAGFVETAEHYQNYREKRRQLRANKPVSERSAAEVSKDAAHFPTDLQYFQFADKFSRWNELESRRETWHEAVHDRIMPWLINRPRVKGKLSQDEVNFLADSLYNMTATPAMRVVQMAGPALDRCNVGVFNCAYAEITDIKSFAELLYVLMQGTGHGFSVENENLDLPKVKKQRANVPVTTIVVEDSTESWCDALNTCIELLFDGRDFVLDTSPVRPKGARLKTKGGRASGPEPLHELCDFIRSVITARQGKYLRDIDVHDICCMIGKIVQVGGVRRASLISLSDLNSQEMRHAKSGNWYVQHQFRGMANNSAVYEEKPSIELFMEEWLSLVRSKSGERGIFNRSGLAKALPTRRKRKHRFGVNPCVSADTWVHTDEGPRRVSDLLDSPFTALVDGVPFKATEFMQTGVKQLYKVTLANGMSFRVTDNHQLLTVTQQTQKTQRTAWQALKDVTVGTPVVLHNHHKSIWTGRGTVAEGEIMGHLVGDGCLSVQRAFFDFWGKNRQQCAERMLCNVRETVKVRSDCVGSEQIAAVGKRRIQSSNAFALAASYGLTGDKVVTDAIEKTSSDFHVGFLRTWFDADGSPQGDTAKGQSVRLWSVKLPNLQAAQRMLARLGINSVIYQDRREAGVRSLPDGNGGHADYQCQAAHELVIANANMQVFADRIGFSDPEKAAALADMLASYKRKLNRERFAEKIVSIEKDGIEPVYDCTVPGASAFDANGAYVHNCAEIILRSRQFCNLSIVVARPDDTEETITRKVIAATIFGTIQATCTDFNYLRPEWNQNTEDEALLGVDITGHADCPLLCPGNPDRAAMLARLRAVVAETNAKYAALFGINRSAADTCVKPSGDSSVFFDCGSGISARFANYQIRWVRSSKDSPISKFLIDQGVPHYEAPEAPERLYVFGFPKKAPKGALVRDDLNALAQLENWLVWKKNWAEHSVSATIYVEDHEWLEVGTWVYKNFDEITGLSFLPKDNGVYKHAPNEELTAEQYEKFVSEFPRINWAKLCQYENEDMTESAQTFACVGGTCEI